MMASAIDAHHRLPAPAPQELAHALEERVKPRRDRERLPPLQIGTRADSLEDQGGDESLLRPRGGPEPVAENCGRALEEPVSALMREPEYTALHDCHLPPWYGRSALVEQVMCRCPIQPRPFLVLEKWDDVLMDPVDVTGPEGQQAESEGEVVLGEPVERRTKRVQHAL